MSRDRDTRRQDPQSEADRIAVNRILQQRAVDRYWANMTALANRLLAAGSPEECEDNACAGCAWCDAQEPR